jgi:hypothetical protein
MFVRKYSYTDASAGSMIADENGTADGAGRFDNIDGASGDSAAGGVCVDGVGTEPGRGVLWSVDMGGGAWEGDCASERGVWGQPATWLGGGGSQVLHEKNLRRQILAALLADPTTVPSDPSRTPEQGTRKPMTKPY